MNASSYKTVFSKRLGALVAVGEHATSQGKANGASGSGASGAGEGAVSALAGIGYVAALSASFAFVSLAWAAPATNALPTGGTVVQGAASMSQTANQLNIQQATQRAAINWQSFDIGASAKVNVAQPNAQAVLLNRVVGQSPSQIFGKLQANGHVILVNPNGVLFGKDGSVNAGGFTASTLNISDANFIAGNMVYERNGSTAGIVNQGSITAAPGGYVALLGATVSNEGSITTKGGSVVMGAGETIKVPVSGTGRIKLELTPAAINASLSNTGSIVTEGGQVYMQALALNRAAAQILHSGSIDTTGEKGGDVHVLADGGHIRVDGRIKANSTNGTAGGDIYIGRDKDTNVLAAVGDVRDASLESQGGFIETSGQFLATDGVSVKAKDWLLDPSNITISTGNDAGYTNLSGTYTPDGGANTSVVKVGTIESAISGGTSVTITTTNTGTQGSGVGNITVDDALNLVNNSATNATLKLIADNGIFVNANIAGSSGTGQSGLVNIDLQAKGVPRGNASSFVATDSSGIEFRNGASFNTNGAIKIDGTNNNTKVNSRGITFNSGSSIKGASFDIKGTATGLATGSHGVHMAGNNSFTSSSTTVTSQINGIAKTNGSIPGTTNFTGITAATNINGNVIFDAGTGSMVVKGSNTSTQLGVRVSEGGGATAITTKGEVTLGALEDNSGFSMRIGSITAETGNLTIRGQVTGARKGVSIIDASTLKTNNPGKNIDIVGRVTTAEGDSAIGVEIGRFTPAPKFDSKGSINIEGTVTGLGTGSGVAFTKSGWGTYAVGMNADGNITIEGNNLTGSINNAIFVNAGLQATAKGNITLKAKTNNAASTAILFVSERGSNLQPNVNYINEPLTGNTSLQSINNDAGGVAGNILIQTNQGSIVLNNSAIAVGSTSTKVPVPPGSTETKLVGKNISIDNTGGTVDTTTGAIQKGSGMATGGRGIRFADDRAIVATENLNITGASSNNSGVELSSSAKDMSAKNITIDGTTSAANASGVWVARALKTTVGDITLKGTDTSTSANSMGLRLGADIGDANTGAVTLTGTSDKGTGVYQGGGTIASKNKITIAGTGGATGVNLVGNVTSLAGGSNFAGVEAIAITGDATGTAAPKAFVSSSTTNITNNSTSGATGIKVPRGELYLAGKIINESSAGAILLSAGDGTAASTAYIAAANTATIEQRANANVVLSTDGQGNITPAKISKTSTGAGDITIAAGKLIPAGTGTGGQVTFVAGNTIANSGSGKTYIYTGSVANSAVMSSLIPGQGASPFSQMVLSGNSQNTKSNAAYGETTGTSATAQVMYREKIKVDLSGSNALNNASASYGTVGNDAQAQAVIKAAKSSSNASQPTTLSWTENSNTFNLNSDALIDTLSVNGPAYSSANKLNASITPYGTTSSTYTTGSNGFPTLTVNKKEVTVGVTANDKPYDGNTSAAVSSSTGIVTGDKVNIAHTGASFADKNVSRDASGNVIAKTVTVSGLSLSGDDVGNYSLQNIEATTTAKITPRPLTIAPGSVGTKTADGNTTAVVTPGTLSNLVGTETLGVAATGTFSDANPGNNKAVNAFYTLQNGANGGVVSNYVLNLGTPANPDTRMTGNILASVNPVTPIAPVNNNTGSVSRVRTVSGFGNSGAATGVLDDTPVTESREVCSDVFPENCECQPSVIPSIEICFAPKSVAATKEEK